LKPIFDAVAKNYADGIKFVKVTVNEEPDLASRCGIQGIGRMGLLIAYNSDIETIRLRDNH